MYFVQMINYSISLHFPPIDTFILLFLFSAVSYPYPIFQVSIQGFFLNKKKKIAFKTHCF